ncbi:MAG: cupin domain-containing protein [bacterium]
MTTRKATSVVLQDGEGERLWFAGGGIHVWKVNAVESGGSFLLFEDVLSQGKATPLHIHPNEDELLYVLDGEILVHIDGAEHHIGTRGMIMAPRGVPHAFLVTSETARVLCFEAPGTAEAFYRGASEAATSEGDASRPPDFKKVGESAALNGGIEILGPPPFRKVG